jgi:hypothetical protein
MISLLAEELTRGNIRTFPATAETKNTRQYREDSYLLNTLAAITSKDYDEEALSVVQSLNLRSALGIFFQSRPKFGGGFESPFVRLEDGTRPMRR